MDKKQTDRNLADVARNRTGGIARAFTELQRIVMSTDAIVLATGDQNQLSSIETSMRSAHETIAQIKRDYTQAKARELIG